MNAPAVWRGPSRWRPLAGRPPARNTLPATAATTLVLPQRRQICDMDELCRQMAPVARTAVDALEIAVALEVQGINDQMARERFRAADVFALAEDIRSRVPTRRRQPDRRPEAWPPTPGRHILHGLLYALPGLCSPAAAPMLGGSAALVTLVVAILVSWALGQGLAFLGYRQLGRAGLAATKSVLLAGLVAGIVLAVAGIGTVAAVVSASLPVVVFAIGHATYLLGATVLMIVGAELGLLLALVPGVVAGCAYLLAGSPQAWQPLLWVSLPVTAGLVLANAVAQVAPGARLAGPWPELTDVAGAVPQAAFGFLCAALLLMPLLSLQFLGRSGVVGFGAALALSGAMGAAEANLLWYRRAIHRLLTTLDSCRRFAWLASAVLAAATLRFLLVVAVLLGIATVIVCAAAPPAGVVATDVVAYLALGAPLFVALVLQSLGAGRLLLPAFTAAVAVQLALMLRAPQLLVAGQIVVCGALLAVLFAHAARVLGQVTRHA